MSHPEQDPLLNQYIDLFNSYDLRLAYDEETDEHLFMDADGISNGQSYPCYEDAILGGIDFFKLEQ